MKMSFLSFLEYLCAKISLLALIIMAGITFVDVFGRVVFNSPLGFAYEVVGICLAISFYAGLYHVHKKRKHIRIDLLEKIFNGRAGQFISWLSYLVEIVFFTALVVMIYQQTIESKNFGEIFMFLGIEKWTVLAVMSVLSAIALTSLLVTFPDSPSEVKE
ncbi:TRAP transporter small permease [Nitrincola nitratireducens]|uniref:TRAP transporter small permease protein n=2 Tax=Nitrincola TaxID=267849 RepID=W9V0N9_9GAMM|nr:TRAP transporter small permease [Nitrincola nitratireducens]EXJ13048.1 TRAP-type C4-dicarboxylate transport system, small permease component [Nitrincola nitratireducens]